MNKNKENGMLKSLGTAIGVGMLAGLAGTVAMTICQKLEMQASGRRASNTPANAVREALDIKPVSESKTNEVSTKIHWVYGTSLGMIRGLISVFGINGLAANSVFFATAWGAELFMLPYLKVGPPITKESPEVIAKDAFFHFIYAFSAGLVFDKIMNEE